MTLARTLVLGLISISAVAGLLPASAFAGCPLSGGYGTRSAGQYFHHVYYLCDEDQDGVKEWEVYRDEAGKPRCFRTAPAAERVADAIEAQYGYETKVICKWYASW